ncbi:MAG TPA: hypothetical protein VHN17_06455 [Steroidobacteraceae bacterium]|nr:hypothetical protein [Steroidobacteraceae bacterium]
MQLSKPLYESLPWLYALGGALLIAASHQLHSGALSVLLLIAGTLAVIGGAAIWLRRRDFRATRAEYWANDGQSDVDVDAAAAGDGAKRAADALRAPEEP